MHRLRDSVSISADQADRTSRAIQAESLGDPGVDRGGNPADIPGAG